MYQDSPRRFCGVIFTVIPFQNQTMSAPKRPSLPALCVEYIYPLMLVIQLIVRGLLPTIRYMAMHPLSIFSIHSWHMSILNAGQPWLLADADRIFAPQKRKVVAQAKGRVLEVGAGTGETVKYYDMRKIDVVYGVEPNVEVLGGLRRQLVKYGMVEKYEILPFGVEESERLAEAGVTPGSIDTIVCVSPCGKAIDDR
jgi:hypothetical protein